MSNKIARLTILILQAIITLAILAMCVFGFSLDTYWLNHIEFAECAIRLICISVFTVFYYNSLAGGFGSDTLFIPIHLLFSVLSEARILDTFSRTFGIYIFPPLEIVNIFIFSTIMTVIPLIGYCIFFDNPSSDSAVRFLLAGIIGTVIVTDIIPKTQILNSLWDFLAIKVLIYSIYIIAATVCFIRLSTDSIGPDMIRHLVCLILVVGNCINLFFNTFTMNLIGTAFLISACTIILIMTKRNAIKM